MKAHIPHIKQVIELHAYVLKASDPTGLDIHFTQSNQKKNANNSTDLVKTIEREMFAGMTDMKGRLTQILAEHKTKLGAMVVQEVSFPKRKPPPEPQRPISFYVLTDGKWQPQNDVASVILDLVKAMEEKRLPKEHVAIQFIRFGEDQQAVDRLEHLDHGLGLKERKMYVKVSGLRCGYG